MFPNPKNHKKVNELHMCKRVTNGYIMQHNENNSVEKVSEEDYNHVIQAIKNIINDQPHKFTYIPVRAIINELENVSQKFKEAQEEWRKKNPNLRNTGPYTDQFYNVLHILNHEGIIAYYKRGLIEVNESIFDTKHLNSRLEQYY